MRKVTCKIRLTFTQTGYSYPSRFSTWQRCFPVVLRSFEDGIRNSSLQLLYAFKIAAAKLKKGRVGDRDAIVRFAGSRWHVLNVLNGVDQGEIIAISWKGKSIYSIVMSILLIERLRYRRFILFRWLSFNWDLFWKE